MNKYLLYTLAAGFISSVMHAATPVITLNGADPINLTVGATFSDNGATAEDDEDGSITVTTTHAVDTAVAGSYTVNYSVTDADGNTVTATRTVIVSESETVDPVISLNGANPLKITTSRAFSDPEATATDTVDGVTFDITDNIVTSGVVDRAPGTYTVTYTVTDAAGNTAESTRTVIVLSPVALELWEFNDAAGLSFEANADGSTPGFVNTGRIGSKWNNGGFLTDSQTTNSAVTDGAGNLVITDLDGSVTRKTWHKYGSTDEDGNPISSPVITTGTYRMVLNISSRGLDAENDLDDGIN